MSRLKAKDLNKKNIAELGKLLSEKRKALSDFRFGIAGSKVKNMKEGRDLKKEIACINTFITLEKRSETK